LPLQSQILKLSELKDLPGNRKKKLHLCILAEIFLFIHFVLINFSFYATKIDIFLFQVDFLSKYIIIIIMKKK
jgi:hypothetical protein